MILSEEQREQHKQMVRRAIALNPNLTLVKLKNALEKQEGLEISIPYISDIVKKVREEWTEQYDHETKALTAARFDELCVFLVDNLRDIITEEKKIYKSTTSIEQAIVSQANRIKAIKEIRDTAKMMIDLKMDLGILERHLGKLDTDVNIPRVRNLVAELIKYREHGNTITIPATAESNA